MRIYEIYHVEEQRDERGLSGYTETLLARFTTKEAADEFVRRFECPITVPKTTPSGATVDTGCGILKIKPFAVYDSLSDLSDNQSYWWQKTKDSSNGAYAQDYHEHGLKKPDVM